MAASSPAGDPRRRLGVEERRRQILDAARALYASTPYEQVSTTQLATAADSSQALLFHYFGTKADLYAAVVADAVGELRRAQDAADAALPPGVPVRDRVRASIEVYLDHIAAHPRTWAGPLLGGLEPAPAQLVRAQARAEYVALLAGLLGIGDWPRHTYALWGYFGFLDHACLHWTENGCPASARGPLIDAALGALEGALGDWQV